MFEREKNKKYSLQSPTWSYVASTINWVNSTNPYKQSPSEPSFAKVGEGLRMVMITSIASVFEGLMKDYLQERLSKTKERIEFTKNKKIEVLTALEIQNFQWGQLKDIFEKIEKRKFKDTIIEMSDIGFYEDVEMIFKFRNFIVHSNYIKEDYVEKNNGSIVFSQSDKKTKQLKDYIKQRKLNIEDESEKYFVEIYFTQKLLSHFVDTMNNFFKLKLFRNDVISTFNQINLVWKS